MNDNETPPAASNAREGMCPSCMENTLLEYEWHPQIPRPGHVADDLICADCHASLRRAAGDDEHPLVGMSAPPPMSSAAISGLMRISQRGLL